MRIYRNHYRSFELGSQGFGYFSSKWEANRDAAEYLRNNPEVDSEGKPDCSVKQDVEDVPLTKDGMLRALNHWGSHADNG